MSTTQIMLLGEYLESLKLSGGIGEVFDGRPYAEALEICIANLQFPIGMKTFRDVLSSKGITWKRPSTARNAREAAIALDADLRRREQEVEKRIQELLDIQMAYNDEINKRAKPEYAGDAFVEYLKSCGVDRKSAHEIGRQIAIGETPELALDMSPYLSEREVLMAMVERTDELVANYGTFPRLNIALGLDYKPADPQ